MSAVDVEHAESFLLRFLRRLVRGVPLLPQELHRPQEEPRAQLPAADVGPLIDQERQVAVALHPVGEGVADDRLRRRPDDQRLLDLALRLEAALRVRLEPRVRDDRALHREAFDVVGFLREEALRDEEREVGVDVPRRLEAPIEAVLEHLPDGIAMRLDDHAAAHRRVLGQVTGLDHVQIPLGIVVASRRDVLCHRSRVQLLAAPRRAANSGRRA